MLRLFRTVLPLGAVFAFGLALAGCTITSDKPLIEEAEAAAPLPDAFTYFPYEAGDSGYILSSDAPADFVRQGNSYVASNIPDTKGSLEARFLPIGNDVFLMAATITDDPGIVYGFARYADGVLAIAMSPGKKSAATLGKARSGLMPQARRALSGLAVDKQTDGIKITTRAALDYLSSLYVAGRLPMEQLSVGYLSLDPTTAPPHRLSHVGHNWLHTP